MNRRDLWWLGLAVVAGLAVGMVIRQTYEPFAAVASHLDAAGTLPPIVAQGTTSSAIRAAERALCVSGSAVGAGNEGLLDDCAVLLQARDTLRGTATLNWSADTAIADWTGIALSGTPQRVTELTPTYAGLNGSIPPVLGSLPGLEDLQLSNNALTGSIPAELGSLSELDILYLHNNQLEGAIPAELGNLAKLRFLGLRNNQLTGTIPAAFASLWELQDLYLNNNQLTGAIPALLGDLDLRILYVAGNSGLTGCIPAALSSVTFSDLATLSLEDCEAEPTHTLTTSRTGIGSISPAPGAHSHRSGALVRVEVTPGDGYRVASWGGDCSGNGRATECILTLDAARTASVTFEAGEPIATYTLTTSAGSNGSISPAAGTHIYDEDTSVTVTAAPGEGYRVGAWGGDCSGAALTCVLTMDADKTASVTFERTAHTLTTSAGANGSISPAAGSHSYDEDTSVTITATPDEGYGVDSWGGDCSGTALTCVLTMDADKAARVVFAPSGAVCTTATDATCVRAVYTGAPGDYSSIADIPADALITPDAAGRYHVERGEQVTVITAATVPTGYTRFYLQWRPEGTPPPTSFTRLIPPVGTTYTFTPTEDEAGSTLITFDLTAARPRPLSIGDKPELGDVVATTVFQVVSCGSGVAVPAPTTNGELVGDCEQLLALRDTLEGAAALNWSARRAMTSWAGVTMSGTPRHVTELELANSGLTGELTGLLGTLTALTELRLDGNALTGMVPSKLGQLADLTHVYLAGNNLTGCVPTSLRAVANNDIPLLNLADCGAPADVSDRTRGDPLPVGTYQFDFSSQHGPLVFDIPPGASVELDYLVVSEPQEGTGDSTEGLLLQDEATKSWVCLDLVRAIECNRWVSGQSVDVTFDRIIESLWVAE